jgi:hypothetical protein
MSYTWGDEKREDAKRYWDILRKTAKVIVARSDLPYWVVIVLMLIVGILLLATLLDTSPIF